MVINKRTFTATFSFERTVLDSVTWSMSKVSRLSKAKWFDLSIVTICLVTLLPVSGAKAATYLFHNDHLGTPQAVTDMNQQIAWQSAQSPFNEITEIEGQIEQNLRLPGQYYDRETQLSYNYYRYYDSEIGRYITSDPIGLDGGISTYGYAGGNPVINYDPFGLDHGSIYDGVDSYFAVEGHYIAGAGFTVVKCQTECGDERTMMFVKLCLGLAYGPTAGAGVVAGLDGNNCSPEPYSGYFLEGGASVGPFGGSIDIGTDAIGAGPTIGAGAQIGVCYYWYVGEGV